MKNQMLKKVRGMTMAAVISASLLHPFLPVAARKAIQIQRAGIHRLRLPHPQALHGLMMEKARLSRRVRK